MTEETDLLARVLAEPDDDNVRLVYADWLQEHGDEPRAELVRAQIQLARMSPPRQVRPARVEIQQSERFHAGFGARRLREPAPDHGVRAVVWCEDLNPPPAPGDVIDLVAPAPGPQVVPGVVVTDVWREPATDDSLEYTVFEIVCAPDRYPERERLAALRGRERELLDAAGYAVVNAPRVWPVSMTLGALDDGDGSGRLSVRRGFVEWWRMSGADWLAHGDELLTAHPLRRVILTTTPDLIAFLGRGGQKRGFVGPIDRDWWLRALADEWPGITFELPP